MTSDTTTEPTWGLVRTSLAVSGPLGLVCAGFGLLVLTGYALDIEALYRPLSGRPATNPMTALVIILIGASLACGDQSRVARVPKILIPAAILLTLCRLADAFLRVDLTSDIMPFQGTVQLELALGKQNGFGVNTAVMLFGVSFALALHMLRRPFLSQIIAFLALGVPLVSYTGYAYGFDDFYGQMSLLTASVGIALSISALGATARQGAVRALLSPYVGGRIARAQVALGVVVPFLMGFLIVKALFEAGGEDLFGIFVIGVSWFLISMICISAIVQEHVDSKRRAIERALFVSATVDPLTNLPNRRDFFDVADRKLEFGNNTQAEHCVLMVDLDHFKNINDTAGHAMGDEVLKTIAGVIRETVRSVDIVGRLGGEEFAVLLPDTDPAGALSLAEKLRVRIQEASVPGWTDNHGPVTASIGYASSTSRLSLNDLLSSADEALYKAKEQGRNRVVAEERLAMAYPGEGRIRLVRAGRH